MEGVEVSAAGVGVLAVARAAATRASTVASMSGVGVAVDVGVGGGALREANCFSSSGSQSRSAIRFDLSQELNTYQYWYGELGYLEIPLI